MSISRKQNLDKDLQKQNSYFWKVQHGVHRIPWEIPTNPRIYDIISTAVIATM